MLGMDSFLLTYVIWGLDSGCQDQAQVSLPTEPSPWHAKKVFDKDPESKYFRPLIELPLL